MEWHEIAEYLKGHPDAVVTLATIAEAAMVLREDWM